MKDIHYYTTHPWGVDKNKNVCVCVEVSGATEGRGCGGVGWSICRCEIRFYCVSLISYLWSIWKGPQTQTGNNNNNNNNNKSQTWIVSGSVETSSRVTHLFLVRNTTNAVTGQPYWKGERGGVGGRGRGWGGVVHNYSILMSITRV